jgi:alkylation response protein AidB-like acyl-CoA dehydrogenase
MDFDFSDEQTQLSDAVRRYVDKAYTFDRRWATEKAGGFDAKAYGELAELGLTGLCISSDFDGMGMGAVECMLVLNELGRGIVAEPIAQAFIAGPVIESFGSDAQKAAWLLQIASGEAIVSLAHTERASRYASSRISGSFSSDATELSTFSATKIAVPAAAHAKAFLVSGKLGGALALGIVDAADPGVKINAYTCQDGTAAGDVTFANAKATLLSGGAEALQLALDLGAACTCAFGVGAMEKALAITSEYMNTRKQFNTTLATFQALRHRAADMKMALELARSMSMYASLKLGAPTAERSQAMSRAKVQVGRSMRLVSQEAVQLHGGIGVTDECNISHYFRVLTALEMQFGDTLHHLGEVSSKMTEQAGVFA